MSRTIFIFTFSLFFYFSVFGQVRYEIVIGERIKIKSDIIGDSVEFQLFVPQDYNKSDLIYPVIYLLNGEQYFHTTTGVVRQLAKSKEIPDCIVVGLTPDSRFFLDKNESKTYFDFIDLELSSFLENNYKTSPYKIIIANSIYAQLSLYGLISKGNTFNSYILSSPFFTIDDYLYDFESFVDDGNKLDFNLQISCGYEQEYKVDKTYKLARVVKRALVGNSNWEYKYYNDIDRELAFLKTIIDFLPENFDDLKVRQPLADYSDFDNKFSQRDLLIAKYGYDYLDLERAPKSIGQKILENIDNEAFFSEGMLASYQNKNGYFSDDTEILNVIRYLQSIGKTKESDNVRSLLSKSKKNYEYVNNYTNNIELERGLLYNLKLDSTSNATFKHKGAEINDIEYVYGVDNLPSTAVSMTSSQGKIRINHSPEYDPKKSVSISCWIYPNQLRNADSWAISMKLGNKGPHWNTTVGRYLDQWGFEIYNIGRFVYLVNDSIHLNQWNHVVIVADQSIGKLTFYKNGIQIAQRDDLVPFLDSAEILQIGNDIFSFDGKLDEFRLYQRVISEAEVKELYNAHN
ncbi:LamG-like jellyroll fold domain-containing protein [Roseimarinus sediminis]|uniref:LamG-like jellyroll fold domain-containing protein n=1 Tax=Roseimarinus sediminis TaxID=1610899 RepID=UPI003D196B9E